MQLGVNYLSESMYLPPPFSRLREDLKRMRKYGFEAIRITGDKLPWLLKIATEAKKLGLEVWLCPRFASNIPLLSKKEYLKKVQEFARIVEKANIDVFIIGNELSLELRDFAPNLPTYEIRCSEGWQRFQKEFQRRKRLLRDYLTLLAKEAKKYFSSKVTYAAGTWELDSIDWRLLDIISANLYLWKGFTEKEYVETLKVLKSYQKPVAITEFGFTTTQEAWEIGSRHIYGLRKIPKWILNLLLECPNIVRKILRVNRKFLLKTLIPHHYDEDTQKKLLQKNLELLKELNIDYGFIFQWSEPWPSGFGLIKNNGNSKKTLQFLKNYRF
jgi:hypothetical protein